MKSNKMMKTPLVSLIITTKNEEETLSNLLTSIKKQTYTAIETIVVDNNSSDMTTSIAKKYDVLVVTKGPERSAQRNYGAKIAKGDFLLFLDADMELSKTVISDCVAVCLKENVGGIIIPEGTFGIGFWAKVKAYERSFYIGDEVIEAARCYPKKIFTEFGGFDENITGPEDWDLSDKIKKKYGLGRIKSMILHNEGKIELFSLMKKKYYYGKHVKRYASKNNMSVFSPKTFFFFRKAFYRNPLKICKHPILFFSMIYMLLAELFAGSFGYLKGSKY